LKASIAAKQGDLGDGRQQFDDNLASAVGAHRSEVLSEYAEMEAEVGDARKAELLLSGRRRDAVDASTGVVELVRTLLLIRAAEYSKALEALLTIRLDKPEAYPGFQSRLRAWRAIGMALAEDPSALAESLGAVRFAEHQGADAWGSLAALALGHSSKTSSSSVLAVPEQTRFVLSLAAELIVRDVYLLEPAALAIVAAEATRAPERWRPALRHAIAAGDPSRFAAARLLDLIGELEDVPTLRSLAKSTKRSGQDRLLGRGLARRLAPIAEIHDLGRLTIGLGGQLVSGGDIRRKVSALLCFLLTRPRWAATREEVMEAMWPDMDPSSAVNSLNQSVYFLRRVFEPHYTEDTTAGYVQQDTDLLWLDQTLLTADSAMCAQLATEFGRTGEPHLVVELVSRYAGRFALDFAYEDWSTDFREWLHVAYLQAVETQIRSDVDLGQYQRGIAIARAALEVEPRNEELELSLLKLLRGSGAHSAAAEQYSRYANVLRRDLGVEPPPWDAL
jgi:DNA-binding SARP family transcriptional activator